MKVVGAGLLLGLAITIPVAQLIRTQLFQTSTYDPTALSVVSATLAATGLLACWIPARRATKVDPISALRAE